LAKTDTYPGDEACVLAAKALEALQTGSSNAQARVQQLCLLEFLLADSEYNSEARHWQMTTLQRTGLGSLAYASLGRLDVKGVLYETQFARFFLHWGSSFPDVKKTKGSAYEKMGEALVFYREAEASISEALEVALEHQNYAQLVQFEALKERLRLSPTRRMLNFERRRIARLAGHAYDAFDDEIGLLPYSQRLQTYTNETHYRFKGILGFGAATEVFGSNSPRLGLYSSCGCHSKQNYSPLDGVGANETR